MTTWIISLLIVALCISIVVHRYQHLQIADLRRELRDATDWMAPNVIEDLRDDG